MVTFSEIRSQLISVFVCTFTALHSQIALDSAAFVEGSTEELCVIPPQQQHCEFRCSLHLTGGKSKDTQDWLGELPASIAQHLVQVREHDTSVYMLHGRTDQLVLKCTFHVRFATQTTGPA